MNNSSLTTITLNRLFAFLVLIFSSLLLVSIAGGESTPESDPSSTTPEVRRWEITGPWGGDVRSMVVAPDNADFFYLGTSDGQIFRSTDGATTWRRLKPGLPKSGLSVDAIVVDRINSSIVYAGTWAVRDGEEGGVFKSENGGLNWHLLAGTKGLSVRSLAMAPLDPTVIIAGTANDDLKLNGVYRSSDAGTTWSRISPEGDKEIRNIQSIAIDPTANDTIYVGTWHLPWKTTDSGITWKPTGYRDTGMIDDSDIFGININPSNANSIYMNACSGIYHSESAGEKWSKIGGIPFSSRRTYTLLLHPTDPKILFAGTSEGLWRAKDGGRGWRLLTSRKQVIRAVAIHKDQPNRVVIASDDFGIQVSNDLGGYDGNFVDANEGFISRHVLAILPDSTERGRILASVFHDGTAGSVFLSTDGGINWHTSSRGLAGRDVFAFYQLPDSPNEIYAGTNTGIFNSTDRGESWAYLAKGDPKKEPADQKPVVPRPESGSLSFEVPITKGFGKYISATAAKKKSATTKKTRIQSKRKRVKPQVRPKPKQPQPPDANSNFKELTKLVDDITSYIDESGKRVLLAATFDGLYKTTDPLTGWEKILITDYPSDGRVFAISTHKEMPNTIFAGTSRGLFITYDAGTHWLHVDRGPSDMPIKAIAQDPLDPNFIIVGTNQFVFRTINGGRSWITRGGGLLAGDYTSVTINPMNPREIMVGEYSRGGIYRSRDRGYTWDRIDDGLPSRRVWALTYDPFEKGRVYAGSFSSGVYVLTYQRSDGSRR